MHTHYKQAAACLNAFLLVAITMLSISNYQRGNKRRSWASAFHILCIIWLCFRQVFWYLTLVTHGSWTATEFYLVYWLPHPIQFAMYLLVPLFYAKVLSELGRFQRCIGKGQEMREKFAIIQNTYIACILLMVLFMIGCVVTAGSLEKQQYKCLTLNYNWREARHKQMFKVDDADDDGAMAREECYHIALSTIPVRWLSAISFIFLSGVVMFYGYQIGGLTDSEAHRFFINNPQQLCRINTILFFIFITRGIYEVFILKGYWYLPELPLNADTDLDWRSFVCVILWDYLPLVVLMNMSSTSSTQPGILVAPSLLSPRGYDNVVTEEEGVQPSHKPFKTNDRRDRSNSDGSNYGSIPRSSNWQSRHKLTETGSGVKIGSGDASMVNPWHLLAQKNSGSDEAIGKESLWRVRQGWSPSSSLDRVPVRNVHLDFTSAETGFDSKGGLPEIADERFPQSGLGDDF